MKPLSATGERYIPEFFSGVIALEHLHRYKLALELADDKDVLDIASGEGYGSHMLMARARSVIGVDIDPEAVSHAQLKYRHAGLSFVQGSATEIPLEDNSIDIVVSFETIEHLDDHDKMISELLRVLRPNGTLIISSPNKAVYSDKTHYKNQFHKKELYTDEFIDLIRSNFANIAHYSQKTTAASVITSNARTPFLVYTADATHADLPESRYDIIVASNAQLTPLAHSVYEMPDSQLQPERSELLLAQAALTEGELRAQQKTLQDSFDALRHDLAKAQTNGENLKQQLEEASQARSIMNQRYLDLLSSARQMADDANLMAQDKWWLRSKFFRNISNSIRKRKGKEKKAWRTHFSVQQHEDNDPQNAVSYSPPPTTPMPTVLPSVSQKFDPHITVVAMARNETQRAHDAMRHFCALFDRVVVIDHLSDDDTAAIVGSYNGTSGAKVTVLKGEDTGYYQSEYMSAAANALAREGVSDWVFFLDFDEFLPFNSAREFRQALVPLASCDVIHSHWYNLALRNLANGSVNGAEVEISDTVSNYVKIALNLRQLAGGTIAIEQGNHSVSIGNRRSYVGQRAFGLFHVPIVSEEAFWRKIDQGAKAYESIAHRDQSQGSHWRDLNLKASKLSSQPPLLREIALRYGDPVDAIIESVEAGNSSRGRSFKLKFAQSERATKTSSAATPSFNLDSIDRIMAECFPQPASQRPDFVTSLSKSTFSQLPERIDRLDEAGKAARIQRVMLSAPTDLEVIVPTAWSGHKPFLFTLMEATKPRRYVELGTHNGASFFAACQHYKSNGNYGEAIAIDLWEGDHQAGYYDESTFENFKYLLSTNFPNSGKFIRSYFSDAVKAFDSGSIDLLHIDGLHTYDAVQEDYETWRSRVSANGIILFHDTSEYQTDFGVWQLFEEVRASATASFKFSHSHGLGIMALGDPNTNPAIELLNYFNESPEIVENYYSILGRNMFQAARMKYHEPQ
ncbi:methyltransferase domain-containing protein (plasmid) [Aminobacter sp. BA135]|uniref:methyltransferase domain-containing protein n=1 Tax=Aminobacter sp. BA135 TaxID=537596 RepID=UPI003D7AB30F